MPNTPQEPQACDPRLDARSPLADLLCWLASGVFVVSNGFLGHSMWLGSWDVVQLGEIILAVPGNGLLVGVIWYFGSASGRGAWPVFVPVVMVLLGLGFVVFLPFSGPTMGILHLVASGLQVLVHILVVLHQRSGA